MVIFVFTLCCSYQIISWSFSMFLYIFLFSILLLNRSSDFFLENCGYYTKFPFGSLKISLSSLLKFSIFHSTSIVFHLILWFIVIKDGLKSLSYNLNIYITWVLMFPGCPFSLWNVKISLVLNMLSNFGLWSGHFG